MSTQQERTYATGRSVFVIDGMNLFLRSFMVNEAMSTKSEPIGGVVGFMKSLYYLVANFSPGSVYVVWESGGGCPRRKALYPEYKANRAKVKDFQKLKTGGSNVRDLLAADSNSKVKQLALLYRLLNYTPVCQVFVKDTEGDDVVSYLVKDRFAHDPEFENSSVVIVSTDKDYYQLLENKQIKVYDPAKKVFIDHATVLETFGISARNFALAKAIVGDPSDNIEGVPGVGFKTAQKRLQSLLETTERDTTVDDIMVECQARLNDKKTAKIKLYRDVLGSESIIKRNWKLMYLNTSTLSGAQIEKINWTVDNHEPKMDKLGLIKTVVANGISMTVDVDLFSMIMNQNLVR